MASKIFYKRCTLLLTLWCYCCAACSQKSIADLRSDLEKAISAKEKAEICYSISMMYVGRLKVDSALFFADKVKELSVPANYVAGTGKHHLALAAALFLRRRKQEVLDNVGKAIEIFNKEKNYQFLGLAYRQLGAMYSLLEESFVASKSYWTAIYYSTLAGDDNALSREYFEMGRNYYSTFDADSSTIYYAKALASSEKVNDKFKIYLSAGYLGILFLSTYDFSTARKYFEYSFANRIKSSDKVTLRIFLNGYAESLLNLHEYEKADSVITEFENISLVLNDEWGKIFLINLRGNVEFERKNYQKAYAHFLEAYQRLRPDVIDFDVKGLALNLGMAEIQLQKYDSAIVHLKRAAWVSRQMKYIPDEMNANVLISESFEKINQPDSALHYFRNYSVLKESAMSQQKQKTIIEVTTRYETEKKEQVIKILEKEKEADVYALALKNQQLEKQELESEKRSQQLLLLSQQSEINRLETAQKNLALQNQEKEMIKKQGELESISKENELRKDIAIKENQQKWIAYGAVLAVLIFGSVAFFRYRQSRKLSKQLAASLISLNEAQEQLIKTEKEKEAENVRVRISRDIHDEVGATLSGVALYSEIAKQKMEEHKEKDAQIYLNHISANSKEMVEKMSDIVWAINPDNDSFERIIAKLQSYAFNLCAGKGIGLHMNISDTVSKHYPSMQVKRNLYLFMKEAINNAVKYSGAKNISLSLQSKGDAIVAEIKDDGKGFDTSLNYMGNGLKNMKARADSLDGSFAIESAEGKGTCIRVRFQFHPTGGQANNI